MPTYRASRWFNTRARHQATFEADCDEAAKAKLATIHWEEHPLDALTALDDPDINEDALIDLDRVTPDHSVIIDGVLEGQEVPDAMPYSWDAAEFVKRMASFSLDFSADMSDDKIESELAAWRAMITKAREICGVTE